MALIHAYVKLILFFFNTIQLLRNTPYDSQTLVHLFPIEGRAKNEGSFYTSNLLGEEDIGSSWYKKSSYKR